MAKPLKPPSSPFDALVKIRRAPAEPAPPQSVRQLTVHTSEQLNSQMSGRAKSVDPDFTKFTTYIRKHTHRAVKLKLIEQGKEFSDLVQELLSDWLQKQSSHSE